MEIYEQGAAWNQSNDSEIEPSTVSSSITADAFVTVYALTIFVANALILTILSEILLKMRGRKEAIDTIVNMFFICLNDTMCGIILIVYTALQIKGNTSGQLCAYVVLLSLTLLIMSHGNILCICIQRYRGTKNIRNVRKENQKRKTLSLLLVNITVGILGFIFGISQADISHDTQFNGPNLVCTFKTGLGSSTKMTGPIFYTIKILMTIVADILCLVTIVKLKREMKRTICPGPADSVVSEQSTKLRLTMQTRQHRAIITMLLVLVFFNVSMLPHIIFIALKLSRSDGDIPARVFFLTMYINSLVNPFVIMTRTQEIRLKIIGFFTYIKNRVHI